MGSNYGTHSAFPYPLLFCLFVGREAGSLQLPALKQGKTKLLSSLLVSIEIPVLTMR
jgi:hypothetical protein